MSFTHFFTCRLIVEKLCFTCALHLIPWAWHVNVHGISQFPIFTNSHRECVQNTDCLMFLHIPHFFMFSHVNFTWSEIFHVRLHIIFAHVKPCVFTVRDVSYLKSFIYLLLHRAGTLYKVHLKNKNKILSEYH